MPPAPVDGLGEMEETAGAVGGLSQAQPASQQWVRQRMQYKFITAAMRPRFLEGVDAVPSLTQQLFAAYDPECTMWELRNRIEHMVMERGDVCVCIHHWLHGRLALPESDYRNIIHELMHMLTCFGRI